jgi:hypothetical protein
MRTYLKKNILFLLVLLSSLSCREEIISPDNFVEGVNDPVQLRERDSYILLLNADNFTMDLTVPNIFTSIRTRFNVTLADYKSGYTSVTVQDYNSIERFRYFIADEVPYHSDLLDGYVPTKIRIRTQDFSGKIKIEFRRTL